MDQTNSNGGQTGLNNGQAGSNSGQTDNSQNNGQPPVNQDQTANPQKSAQQTGASQTSTTQVKIDLTNVKTKSGKSISDFEIPANYLEKESSLIDLVIRSESMNDGERQYWFNLMEIMSPEQVEKLRDILTRERKKLAEIEAKYGKPKVQLSPEEIAAKNIELQQKRDEQKTRLAEKEKQHQQEENDKEAEILAELENM